MPGATASAGLQDNFLLVLAGGMLGVLVLDLSDIMVHSATFIDVDALIDDSGLVEDAVYRESKDVTGGRSDLCRVI